MEQKSMRQAVIIIHGIGEQRPMDTLRNFAKQICGGFFRNKPDKMSTSFELRRLQLPSSREKHRPATDFYEYYWAHHIRNSKFKQIFSWLKLLLFRKPSDVSESLRSFYYLLWLILLLCLYPLYHFFCSLYQGNITEILLFITGILTLYIIDYSFLHISYGVIDDAARYLNSHPENIKQRNKIKKEGLKLLKTLHKSKKYSRIVVVGHSLGTVIAYDLLRLYWLTLELPKEGLNKSQKQLKKFSKLQLELFSNDDYSDKEKVSKYQELQLKTWLELRQMKWPWLITDLITIGSPLTHADMLLTKNNAEFKEKRKEGEYPTCPPLEEHGDLYYPVHFTVAGQKRTHYQPTHLSPFICTQWSNIYFPHKKIVKGDLVSGPLQKHFGQGIRDIASQLSGFSGYLPSHVKYWSYPPNIKGVEGIKHPTKAIIDVMKLDCLRGKMKWPKP